MGTNGGELGETQATREDSDLIWVTEECNDLCGELTTGARFDQELARLRPETRWQCHAAIFLDNTVTNTKKKASFIPPKSERRRREEGGGRREEEEEEEVWTFSKIDLSLEASLKLLPLEALLAEAPKFISRKLFMHSFDISMLNKIFIYIKVPIYCDNEFNNIWVLKRSSFRIHLDLVRSLDIRVLHLLLKSYTP
uniref:Uncharacterized protein n=1 Tax=Ficus carica TaxID=3494 RepID=A0AA88E5A0_FICCA|nr:hypothetical protein TIFTF001_036891 [Ficus carica]GMN67836.1 hypothetical protein TIFTF001_036897 [Ficus carica]